MPVRTLCVPVLFVLYKIVTLLFENTEVWEIPWKILMDATTWRIGTFLGRMDCFKSTCTQRNGETRNPRYAVDIQFVDHTGWKPTCSPELRMNCLPLGTLGFPGV